MQIHALFLEQVEETAIYSSERTMFPNVEGSLMYWRESLFVATRQQYSANGIIFWTTERSYTRESRRGI